MNLKPTRSLTRPVQKQIELPLEPAPVQKAAKTVKPDPDGKWTSKVEARELQYDEEGNILPPNKKPKKASNKWAKPGLEVTDDRIGSIDPDRFAELKYWVIKREEIRRNKAKGLPPPWTDDPLMANTRWCNVRRMDDKVSQWLLDNFYTHQLSPAKMAVATVVARQVNRISTMERLYPNGFRTLDLKRVKGIMDKMDANGEVILTGVYIIQGGAPGMKKYEAVCESFAQADRMLKDEHIDTDSMENTWKNLQMLQGIGSFLAGQLVADLRHIVPGNWKDKMRWAPLGPGSARGCNILFGQETDAAVNQKLFEKRLAMIIQAFKDDPELLAIGRDRKLEAHDFQNCLCELQKYVRALGGGKSKNRYTGHLIKDQGKLL